MEEELEGPAAVVNISTLNYSIATPGLAAYCAAKASVSQFTKAAAMEFAPLGIRVNAIAPGLTRTPLAERFFGDAPEVPQAFVDHTPMDRVGMPIDQARAAVFLAGEASGWITGVTLNVDGGMHTDGVPDNWELMKGPLGLSDPQPSEWMSQA
jgi:3-oxoacyl-[acyl-carrier protein] reductase